MKIKQMKNWTIEQQDIETGHLFYIPRGQTNPVVLSGYGKYYAVTGFWVNPPNKLLWLELWRTNKAGVVVKATLSPDELMEMKCGLCDEKELDIILSQSVVNEYFFDAPPCELDTAMDMANGRLMALAPRMAELAHLVLSTATIETDAELLRKAEYIINELPNQSLETDAKKRHSA